MSEPTSSFALLVEAGGETSVVCFFLSLLRACYHKDPMPWSDPATDTVKLKQSLPLGRADIVLYHADGTATVIEAKDGRNGYQYVVSAIGQASLYAAQLHITGAVKKVRRAILWSFISSHACDKDLMVIDACHFAGVIPLWIRPLCSFAQIVDAHAAMKDRMNTLFDIWEAAGLSADEIYAKLAELAEAIDGTPH